MSYESFIATQLKLNQQELFEEESLNSELAEEGGQISGNELILLENQILTATNITRGALLHGGIVMPSNSITNTLSYLLSFNPYIGSIYRYVNPTGAKVESERYIFRVLLKNNPLFKLFEYISCGNIAKADSYFRKNHALFLHSGFQQFLSNICFQNAFEYIHFLNKNGVRVNIFDNGFPLIFRTVLYDLQESFQALLLASDFDIDMRDRGDNTILHIVARRGNLKTYEILFRHQSCISILNSKNSKGETPILTAVKNGHFGIAEQLMALDQIDLIVADSVTKKTLLHYFVEGSSEKRFNALTEFLKKSNCVNAVIHLENNVENSILFKTRNQNILYWLIINGIDLNKYEKHTHKTLLYDLAKSNDKLLVKLFCETLRRNHPQSYQDVLNQEVMSDTYKKDNKRRKKTALIIAVEKKNDRIVNSLIEFGANFFAPVDDKYPLDYASCTDLSYYILWRALTGNITRQLTILEQYNALIFCCSISNFGAAKRLIERKIVVRPIRDCRVENGNGLILIILTSNFSLPQKRTLVGSLLSGRYKDNINQANIKGETPLILVTRNCSYEFTHFLLTNSELEINHTDNKGNTALHYAAAKGLKRRTKALLAWRGRNKSLADPNIQNKAGETPLHLAKNPEIVEMLIYNGAIPYIKDNNGNTPRDRAIQKRKSALVQTLKNSELIFNN